MKFNSKDRTEMLKVRVSEEEKTLIQAKAKCMDIDTCQIT